MDGILTALWPLFALLTIGYLARRFDFPGATFWPPAERATYYVLFPSLLVARLSRAELGGAQSLQLIGAVLALLLLASLLMLALRPLLRLPNAQFTSVYQGGLRFNTYVALAASAALIPGQGVVLAAVITAVMIPTLNLLCVLMFAWFGSSRPSPAGVLRTLVRNPLILACLLGITLNISGLGLPAPVLPVLELLGGMALPLGLLAVGAALDLRGLRHSGRAVLASASVKLLLFPPAAGAGTGAADWARSGGDAGAADIRRGADGNRVLYPGPAARRRCTVDGNHHHGPDTARHADHAVNVESTGLIGLCVANSLHSLRCIVE